MSQQLVFDLGLPPALRRTDFVVGPANAVAVRALDASQDWPTGKALLIGPEGAGKSHLAKLWAEDIGAAIICASDLTDSALPALTGRPLVLEGAEALAGDPRAEAALFHLHNLLSQGGRPLLITARRAPRDWGLMLPDLASRLQTAAHLHIRDPDDDLLRAVLAKQFADRQLRVEPGLIDWLALRMTRSWPAIGETVAALDRRALEQGLAVSRALAQDWLEGDGLFPEFR